MKTFIFYIYIIIYILSKIILINDNYTNMKIIYIFKKKINKKID